MSLKNLASIAIMSVVMLISSPLTTSASAKTGDPVNDSSRTVEILQRVTTIQDMNLDELSTSERKALKKEVKGYQKEVTKMAAAEATRGIYLSIGAVIIIILLLILIL